MELSYVGADNNSGTEDHRLSTGSYYTPFDATKFFWNKFFAQSYEARGDNLDEWIHRTHFIEPAVGAGALVFGLLLKLCELGASENVLSQIRMDLCDINSSALDFVRDQIDQIERVAQFTLPNVKLHHSDFLHWEPKLEEASEPFVFANPPFVKNPPNAYWKNSFADFSEKALHITHPRGYVAFIVPLSLCFSREYSNLRRQIRDDGRAFAFSNFDNIPDTLFKSGKPKSKNSNKSNSQRCTIFTGVPSKHPSLQATRLLRWQAAERENLLSSQPELVDISGYERDDQFPRPVRQDQVLSYSRARPSGTLSDLVTPTGEFLVAVSTVARNFIGVREAYSPGTNLFSFPKDQDRLRFLAAISTDEFMNHWLMLGDGFHVTRDNVLSFPMNASLAAVIDSKLECMARAWANRALYRSEKLNSGRVVTSYNFRPVMSLMA
ncbi:hypothetical protein [Paragemmobacter ruber]|uniref:Uncharacterized protein n=1 Tax=Paragemmobacter ruber TaxID=1985673 RepID=A0ABW9YAF2_9RHOB|nr:hypothetical protein [Rhodobacter ruber]NBE09598.1 hypothetical protein [Rhodobacter ruber]